MISIANLLDAAKAKAGIDSDYRLAKVIGITHSVISAYRHGKSMPNEKILSQLCALSGHDVGVVAAQVQAERAQSPEGKSMWMTIAARLSGVASTAFLSVVLAISLIAAGAGSARAVEVKASQTTEHDSLYIVSITILSVVEFLRVRLRQIPGLFVLFEYCFW